MFSGALLFLEARALDEEITLEAEVNKTNIALNVTLTYKLTVSSLQSRIPEPKFPKFSGFNILSQANTSKVSVEQGKVRIYLSYIFVLAPTRPGAFTISPSQLTIGEKTYSSAEFKIKVEPVKPQPKATTLPKQPEVTP
jgi:hypothetical protein